jgi:hypothetical protein
VFGVRSDDGFKVTTGANAPYTDLVLGVYEGGRSSSESQFAFNVTTAGLYPFRLLYYEASGGADCEFYSYDLDLGERVLINDPGSGNSIKAYRIPASSNVSVRLLNPRQSGSNFAFDFQTVSGKTYTIEYKNALADANWSAVAPSISGDGTLHTVSYPLTANRLYRLKVN